jgi:hypothetical protein
MKERRAENQKRNICADLLTIRWTEADGASRSEQVILEDISATGACLHLGNPIPPETEVALHYSEGKYRGTVKYCASQEIGHLLGIAFEDGHRWSKTDFHPSHLLELRALLPGKVQSAPGIQQQSDATD